MAKNRFLLIVEGEKTEPTIFKRVLEKYGYNVIKCDEKLDIENFNQLSELEFENEKNNVVIIEGPRNRIHDFLKVYNENTDSFEKLLSIHSELFQGIFLMYDVDHNDCEDINEMFSKFNDETSSGLLLLSSPCIEVLGDFDTSRKEERFKHIKDYKKVLNEYYNANKKSINDYIVDNFEKLCIYYLDKNKNDFDELNVMEHPKLVIDYINKYNERINDEDNKYVIYRYFTTVVYVFIAFINKLTRNIDNYKPFRDWLKRRFNNENHKENME